MTFDELQKTYQIKGMIGKGASGRIILAYQKNLGKYVILKQILNPSQDEESNRKEVDLLKKLKSRYLPSVYDYLIVDDERYTVMEYINGQSLQALIEQKKPFSLGQLRKWGVEIAAALEELHSQKPPMLHLDIKPDNIMIRNEPGSSKNNDAILIDFNVSLDGTNLTNIGMTQTYSSPEQIRVIKRAIKLGSMSGLSELTVRSDIYSLGATLYEAATQIPFDARNLKWGLLEQRTSKEFARIIARCLNPDPSGRYPSASALKEDFELMEEASAQVQKWRRTVRTLRMVCIAGIAVFGIMACFGIYLINQEGKDQYAHYETAMERQIENGRYNQAQESYEKAKMVDANKGSVDILRSEMLLAQGRYEEAQEFLIDDVIGMSDVQNNKSLLSAAVGNLAEAQFYLQDYRAASENYQQALSLDPNDIDLNRDYAITLGYLEEFDKADSVLEAAENNGLKSTDLTFARSEIQYASGKEKEAISSLESLKDSVTSPDLLFQIYNRLADWKSRSGDDEGARKVLKEAMEKLPSASSSSLRQQLIAIDSRLASQTKDSKYLKEEASLLEEVIAQDWATYQDMNNLAVVYQKLGEYDQAESMIDEMEDLQPGYYNNAKRRALLELEKQASKAASSRSYTAFEHYYQQATGSYDGSGDQEMNLLERQYVQVRNGGWLD